MKMEELIEFCSINNVIIDGTLFKQKNIQDSTQRHGQKSMTSYFLRKNGRSLNMILNMVWAKAKISIIVNNTHSAKWRLDTKLQNTKLCWQERQEKIRKKNC